jgi:hypothetical protein
MYIYIILIEVNNGQRREILILTGVIDSARKN